MRRPTRVPQTWASARRGLDPPYNLPWQRARSRATIEVVSNVVTMPWEILDRMERAVAKVRERLLRSTTALNQAGIPYAVVGDRRDDLPAVTIARQNAGFLPEKSIGVTMFLDGPDAKPSESIHLLFAGEKVKEDYPLASPDITTIDDPAGFRVFPIATRTRRLSAT